LVMLDSAIGLFDVSSPPDTHLDVLEYLASLEERQRQNWTFTTVELPDRDR
jgi:hypothetical protein